MLKPIVWIFLGVSLVFAAAHVFFIFTYLYWYHWWLDSVMHFWGGGLITVGVHALATFSRIHIKPTFAIVLSVLVIIIVSWELFEWGVGLFDPRTHVFDTTKDVILGLTSGILMQFLVTRRTIQIHE